MLPAVKDQDVVVITGCAGLIGSRLAQALSGNYRVVGFDLEAPKADLALAEFISCDLTKDADVGRAGMGR